ncbi:DNA polymerase I [Microbacterium phage Pumpernickel]|uniref:DNA polymerase I n=1 Tax=Microbacterium phage Pumpernickel TaxID=2885983 RepID=A0AAE9C3G3_9CAUD|nr:DNA polymerase I [Microbacterium phage Pumpernickel]UDL15904.1 DNA polymerase I [Microbacterium phage Pumpernickel]
MTTTSGGLGNPDLRLIDSVEEAQNFLRWLGERRPLNAISIDLETGEFPGKDPKHALSPWHGRIRLAQVGDGQTGWAMAWDEWAGVFYEGLNNYDGLIIAHNIAFEAKWLAVQSRFQMPWHNAHDTMIASQCAYPGEPAGLKPLTARLVDPRAAQLQEILQQEFAKNGWTWGTVPITFGPYWQYGALDTVITTRLFVDHFYDLIGPNSRLAKAYELEMATRRITTNMEVRGARVDLEYSDKMYNKLMDYSQSVKDWVKDNYYGTSITSPIQMRQLFLHLGAEITERTPKGEPSINKDQLDLFVRDGSPQVQYLAQQVINQRKADKLATSYFYNFQKDAVDGLLHPSINILQARTGRMSITEPALQTLPSGDATVRSAFLPRNEGEYIISSDLDQVEFRLTANFSEDKALIDLFLEADRTGGDTFTSIMRDIYRDQTLQKSDPRRKLVKGTVYGKLYGAGVDKMALTAGVKSEDMQEVVDAFDRAYPGVKLFQKKTEREGMARLQSEGSAYVETLTGRRLRAEDSRVYALTNYRIQGTAAEIFKQNLVKLDAAGLSEYMVVPVHDEIVLSIPKDLVDELKPIIGECMTTSEGWAVPLTAGVDGPYDNWGSKYL